MKKSKRDIKNRLTVLRIPPILVVLALGLLLRLFLANFGTLSLDQNTFIAWGTRLAEVGFKGFYSGWSDYLPGYLYILNLLAQVARTNLIPQVILYKLPAILADIGTGTLIYFIVRKLKDPTSPRLRGAQWGLIGASLYLFNPAILANSTLWGQVDSINSLFSLLSVYLFSINPIFSAISLGVGTIIKPQAAVTVGVIFLLMIRSKCSIKKIILYIAISGTTFFALFLPFFNGGNLIGFIGERIGATFNQYPYTSVNAFNFWAIPGMWRLDSGYQVVGLIAIVILFLIASTYLLKKKGGEYFLLAFAYGVSFIFMTRMHERHLLPIFAPLSVAASTDPFLLIPYLGFSLTYIANMYYSYVWITENFKTIFDTGVTKLFGLGNTLFLGLILVPQEKSKRIIEMVKGKRILVEEQNGIKFENASLSKRNIRILFVAILVFASVTRLFNLGSPPNEYFDEVYHAFTARRMLHHDPKAWEWWNQSPTGFAFEWTHPPIAKEGMVLGMLVFGDNSFGWRLPGAILGIGSVALVFFIAKELFKDELAGVLASSVFALDGLPLVMSRIGMNDSYILFFSLAAVYAYLREKNFTSSLFLGLALASKWSALWLIPIIFIAHFALKKKIKTSYVWFVILPPLIYLASYMPMFTTGHTWDNFIEVQKQMWWYHTRLKATHPYTSIWWSWPFMVRPIYLYTSSVVDGFVANIYAIGNPAIFWGGFAAVLFSVYLAIKERYKKLGLIVFAYFAFFAPWVLSPRIMFLYHYLPSIPFLAIASGYILRRYPQTRVILPVALVLFIYFYPHWAGLKIPVILDTSYYWFDSWR